MVYDRSGIKIYNGDCLEVMRTLDENSVDSVVTDPPYGLVEPRSGGQGSGQAFSERTEERKESRRGGFMGKKWDACVPGIEFWVEALRVAKPGAYLLAFGGTRTYHRLACAIEDAGWEIRDCLMWMYGCLSEDTEILIDGQWELFSRDIVGRCVLSYSPHSDSYEWQAVQETVEYEYDDTAYRIFSDHTDQIVSRNHRCLVERGGAYVFEFAENVALEREARVPILEDLQSLLESIRDAQSNAGIAECDVFKSMCCEIDDQSESQKADGAAKDDTNNMPAVREENMDGEFTNQKEQSIVLQQSVSRETRNCTNSSSEQIRSDRDDIPRDRTKRGQELCVERRSDVLQTQGEICESVHQVHSLPDSVPCNGTQGRVRDGASHCGGDCDRKVVDTKRVRASHKPRRDGQQAGEFDAVCDEFGSQEIRTPRHTRSDLARIEPFHYVGKVWCIRVPSGAFVARRNGKVFVTGNSGFPKSMDVSKQIDKTFGVEREVVGEKYAGIARQCRNGGEIVGGVSDNEKKYIDVTAPATDDAKKFSGYGTALKPAYEPIILARKPLIGTIVQNVLKHGTGGINIDACRIGGEPSPSVERRQSGPLKRESGTWANDRRSPETYATQRQGEMSGRWPANLILSHAAECKCVGTKQVNGNKAGSFQREMTSKGYDGGGIGQRKASDHIKTAIKKPGYANADGTEEIESWECVADCPIRMLDEQAGPQTSGGTPARRFAAKTKNAFGDFNGEENPDGIGSSSGNVSRFFYCAKADKSERRQSKHPTVKPLDLMRYLVRLVTPVGGVVLDPFLGSGTTIEAAREEHCKAIGIDLSEEYCADAVDRLTQGVFNFAE